MALGAPSFHSRVAGAYLARGSHPRFAPDGLVQGGVEEEAGAVEPEEAGGEAACGDRAGVAARIEGFAREVRGSRGADADMPRRRRRRLRSRLR